MESKSYTKLTPLEIDGGMLEGGGQVIYLGL